MISRCSAMSVRHSAAMAMQRREALATPLVNGELARKFGNGGRGEGGERERKNLPIFDMSDDAADLSGVVDLEVVHFGYLERHCGVDLRE